LVKKLHSAMSTNIHPRFLEKHYLFWCIRSSWMETPLRTWRCG
jgi:hypothetical protein